jgi:hypothetical protein
MGVRARRSVVGWWMDDDNELGLEEKMEQKVENTSNQRQLNA